ncbi:MAG: hypothetical protein HKN80_14810 [Acidimicrobiia bacterium]|nr:hypothetical protein [Acidimicrobiia bacterium]
MRRFTALVAVVLIASACNNSQLGRGVPACPVDPEVITSFTGTMLLQMQAVDTAEYVPCLNDLKAGWSYVDLVPDRGKSRFWLDSDRIGSHFLEVTLTASCDVGSATRVAGSHDVDEYRDVELVGSSVTIAIVPVTGREADYARFIEGELEARQINDRNVFVVFDTGDDPLAEKVAEAARRDRPIIVVDERDALDDNRTATLKMPDEDEAVRGLKLDDLFDRLEDLLPEPSFVGTWYRVFQGGCITYEFDAEGTGVDRLAGDVEDALGLFPAEAVRQAMRSAGMLG